MSSWACPSRRGATYDPAADPGSPGGNGASGGAIGGGIEGTAGGGSDGAAGGSVGAAAGDTAAGASPALDGAAATVPTGIGPPPGSVVTDTDLAKARCAATSPKTGEQVLPAVRLPSNSSPGLTTSQNRVLGPDGKVFRGRGANLACPRGCGACACNGTSLADSTAEVIRRIDALADTWRANFIRLHLESYAAGATGVVDDPAYLSALRQIVAHVATKGGISLVLAIWFDPNLDDMGWPTAKTSAALTLLATEFASVPSVSYAVCNEPQKNYDGALDGQVWGRMNDAVAAIRAAESKAGATPHLVLVQGTGGWARRLDYYTTHPITAGGGVNVAYETHVYDHASVFAERFEIPARTLPVIIGEFGPLGDGTMTLSDTQALMTRAEAAGVSYLAWTFHGRCVPSLLVDTAPGACGLGMPLTPSLWGQQLKAQLARAWGTAAP